MTTFPRPSAASESQEPDLERNHRSPEEGHLLQEEAVAEVRVAAGPGRGAPGRVPGTGGPAGSAARGEGAEGGLVEGRALPEARTVPLTAQALPEAEEGRLVQRRQPAQAARRPEHRRVPAL